MNAKRFLKSLASASYESNERRYVCKAAVLAIGLQQRAGVGDRRVDLARHTQDAGRREDALDVEIVVRRDAGRIEAREGLAIGVPVLGDLLPAHARLEDGPRHHLEVVGQRGGLDHVGNRFGHVLRASLRPGGVRESGAGAGRDRQGRGRRSRHKCCSRHVVGFSVFSYEVRTVGRV